MHIHFKNLMNLNNIKPNYYLHFKESIIFKKQVHTLQVNLLIYLILLKHLYLKRSNYQLMKILKNFHIQIQINNFSIIK
jgi:hypothetical protein